MLKLLKKRNFNDIFNDTFGFIRKHGGHYFLNYLIVNGIPILLLLLSIYFLTGTIFNSVNLGFSPGSYNTNPFENIELNSMIVYLVLVVVIAIVASLVQYSYTPVYFTLYQENGGTNFTAKDIFNGIFSKYLGKIIIFALAILLITIPVAIIAGIAIVILLITIVGWLAPIFIINLWFSMSFIEYLNSDRNVFEALGRAFSLLWIRFWDHVGAVLLLSFLALVIYYGVSLVLTTITGLVVGSFSSGDLLEGQLVLSFFILLANQLASVFMQILMQISNMIVYFSAKEEKENISGLDQIEQIGLGE
ncbi:MAG: hypothetical protein JXR60_03210 [Bacteroidales bacterium]|nr:hypothetical protein [Bacteroidales bacterium]